MMPHATASEYAGRLRAAAGAGLSYVQAAELYGLTPGQVAGMARRLGIAFHNKIGSTKERRVELKAMKVLHRGDRPSSKEKQVPKKEPVVVRPPSVIQAVRRDYSGREVTCCWAGCRSPPRAPSKPYCYHHALRDGG